MFRYSLPAALFVCLSFAVSAFAGPPRYSLLDLGVLPGHTSSVAVAINASGQVTGTSAGASNHAFRWTPGPGGAGGLLEDLGALPEGRYAIGNAINDAGQVMGTSDTREPMPRATLWRGGAPLEVFTGNGNANIHGSGINASGTMSGSMTSSGSGDPSKFRAVIFEEDTAHPDRFNTTVLGVLPGGDTLQSFGISEGINDAGQVVGWSFLADGTGNHAVLWEADAAHTIVDLPAPAGSAGSLAFALNQAGAAAGHSYFPFAGTHAVVWSADAGHAPLDLGVLPGRTDAGALGLNDRGVVVGQSSVLVPGVGSRDSRGFVWKDGVMQDLTLLLDASGAGWVVTGADAVNDTGWIAATATTPTGESHAVVLIPSGAVASAPGSSAPESAILLEAAPNPFRSATEVRFALGRPGRASLAVYDAAGRRVATLADGALGAGAHAVRWDGRDAAGRASRPGLYFARLEGDEGAVTRRIVLER